MKNSLLLKALLESELQKDLHENLDSEFQKLGDEIAKGLEKSEDIKESAVVLTLSAVFAIPAIIDAVGSFVKLASKVIGTKKGEDGAEKIIKFAHRLESYFIKPIKFALKKFGKLDDKKSSEMAHLIHKSIVFILLIMSGIGFAKAVQHAHMTHAAAEGVLTAVKGTEIGKYITTKV